MQNPTIHKDSSSQLKKLMKLRGYPYWKLIQLEGKGQKRILICTNRANLIS